MNAASHRRLCIVSATSSNIPFILVDWRFRHHPNHSVQYFSSGIRGCVIWLFTQLSSFMCALFHFAAAVLIDLSCIAKAFRLTMPWHPEQLDPQFWYSILCIPCNQWLRYFEYHNHLYGRRHRRIMRYLWEYGDSYLDDD